MGSGRDGHAPAVHCAQTVRFRRSDCALGAGKPECALDRRRRCIERRFPAPRRRGGARSRPSATSGTSLLSAQPFQRTNAPGGFSLDFRRGQEYPSTTSGRPARIPPLLFETAATGVREFHEDRRCSPLPCARCRSESAFGNRRPSMEPSKHLNDAQGGVLPGVTGLSPLTDTARSASPTNSSDCSERRFCRSHVQVRSR